MKRELATFGLLVGAGALVLWSQRAAGESTGILSMPDITQDPASWPNGDQIGNVCHAIALEEGYNLGPGHAAFDLNNPGDLSPGDEHGFATAGPAQWHGGSYIIHFATPNDGWGALLAKFRAIAAGRSTHYSADWTWEQIGSVYAGDSETWARNVAGYLGVDPGSTLSDYVGAL